MQLTKLYNEFFESEKAGGLILVIVTVISLGLANSPLQSSYINFWNISLGSHSIVEWINDGLMTIFFLLIGLELKREIYYGELSDIKSASLPIFGALGGMIVPAAIFLLFNYGRNTQPGAGIPMATDIAFAIGILSLLGKRVPASLKVFLTALAVIDDLGAIIIIAIFYTSSISLINIFIAAGIFTFLLILNRLKIFSLVAYLLTGVALWYFMLNSGVHATITGVLLALTIPINKNDLHSPLNRLQHLLHKPVAFFILPLFAIANTSILIDSDSQNGLTTPWSLGIICGLVIGKPLGIWLFSKIGVVSGICNLPADLNWKSIMGVGFLGGIGFTMSIFITLLAFESADIINSSKIAILIASFLAGTLGYLILNKTLKMKEAN